MKRRAQRRAKRRPRMKRRDGLKSEARLEKGLGTEIAALFRDVGLKPGEEIPELRGFTIEPPDFGQ